uniref:Alpha-2-macroglobulin bait region domain-containing protein n=1 Tax=Periophthalmus magnuspinnatus TaxID=409849 RepID=A0A3B4A788_9GOBI
SRKNSLLTSINLSISSLFLCSFALITCSYCVPLQPPVVPRSTVASVNVTVQGESGTLSKKAKVLIEPATFIHIIQTDKPIYKPGQTVKFRITSLDANFIPVKRVDPNTNRIAQWLDNTIDGGILDLSHPIIPEAAQGSYVITATTEQGEQVQHSFDIKEYVLPKYEVKVQLPNVITILDKEAEFKVCGKYTYGKPVVGSVKAVFCRRAFRGYWYGNSYQDVCKNFQLTTDKSGCTSQTVDLSEFFLNKSGYHDSFQVEAELQEFGTGVTLKGSARTSFTNDIRTVTFEDEPASYKPGIAFEGKVNMNYTFKRVFIFFPVNKGVLTIPLRQVVKLAPVAQVLVYTVMPGGEAVADSKDFPVQLCLSNKVKERHRKKSHAFT